MRGKAISEFRSPNALPRAPTPLGTEGVLRCCVCCVVDFCLYAAVLRMERCADLVPVFFNIYGGTLGRSRFCILQYLWWYVVPISFLYSSIFMVIRYANLVPVFFDTYSGTLGRSHFYVLRYLQWYAAPIWFWRFFGTYRNILYQSGISGQDAQFASVTCSVFFLSAGSVSQRKVASGRAAAEEG